MQIWMVPDKEVFSKTNCQPDSDGDANDMLNKALETNQGWFDGDKLRRLLFPTIKGQSIFISHAHDDLQHANCAKSKIESEFPRHRVFIDSRHWESVYNVRKILMRHYKAYSVAQHLHIMLIISLARMIQACEYFIL